MRKRILVLYIVILAISSYPRITYAGGYLHIHRFAKSYNLRLSYSLYRDRVILFKPGLQITLRPGTDVILINQKAIRLKQSIKKSKGSIFIPSQIADFIGSRRIRNTYLRQTSFVPERSDEGEEIPQSISGASSLPTNTSSSFVVVLDAGHGGKDPGCISKQYGYYEKDVTLAVTLLTKKYISRMGKNSIKIVLTRSRDVYLDLETRSRIANRHAEKNKKTLFISIHANYSMFNSASRGIETFFYSPNRNNPGEREAKIIKYRMKSIRKLLYNDESENGPSDASISFDSKTGILSRKFASFVQKSMVSQTGFINRGIKRDRFFVLAYTVMPSILIELGFLSNKNEAKKLVSSSFRNKLAKGIASGIIRYIKSSY